MAFRIGFGYDVHQLAEGEEFWLGGILVPHSKGAVGHSDADVLLHVICDAVLGAANMRDIGFHFPDTDDSFKGIDSKILLADTMKIVRKEGFEIGNIDCTICLQRPKIKDMIPQMQKTIAEVAGIQIGQISVKATTTEKLGFVGREEGVSAYAVVLLEA
ncbi:MAG: 2-C-methyl-D-erythritol 2,4-cyclodiphosphate synthase [Flavobacteriales bacterium]|nr:2-C-methyl-D-erythritol 2,4-cyclodiphosphate synthase [Flavobacteriales bacterium]MDG1779684.1 2-C-methyl-D-erythritol 2,4-cyclodiphosphate synthase [Flavobacteriales bacterium]MDG2245618.1 2-C-methyl-D-erythritol 2,4-cyclodiphosphate synthase [Flavobacteriales bacterium]